MSHSRYQPKVFVAGPLFNDIEIAQQEAMAQYLEKAGFRTFVAHRDGFIVSELMQQLVKDGIDPDEAISRAHKTIFNLDVNHLKDSDAIVVDANGIEPDSGTMIEAGIAYGLGIPAVVYHNDIRIFSPESSLNPMLLGITRVPIAKKIEQVPQLVRKAISLVK